MNNKQQGISKNVKILGLVSLFNDLASEMIYPIVPLFLTGVLGAPVAVVGLIEGIAESSTSLLKVFFGRLSDRLKKRKIFVFSGYALSSLSKILIGLAGGWPLVLAARFVDRLGKGVRTPARDALIAEYSDSSNRGLSFGWHRAMDSLGAVMGPLAAVLFLYFFHDRLRPIFLIAFIPGLIGVLLLLILVKEKYSPPAEKASVKLNWKSLNRPFKIFLLISVIFAIGNSSDVFLILRAKDLGLGLISTILVYVLYNFTYALFSAPAGALSDRIGSKKVLLAGFIIFSLVYLAFGLISSSVWLWLLFPVYGCYIALTDGVGKAYIANLSTPENYGAMFGVYQAAIGLTTFFASLIAGLLWQYAGVSAPFIFGAAAAIIAALFFLNFILITS